MQAAIVCFDSLLFLRGTTKNLEPTRRLQRPHRYRNFSNTLATAAPEASTVDYSSTISVFPAEACDTIGGEACNVQMFPEVKPAAAAINNIRESVRSEEVEREYIEYNDAKTVFPGEACDDLGGEFCEPEYQEGVFKEAISR